MVDDI